jgi:hypothetical protein
MHLELSKFRFYVMLQCLLVGGILLYQLIWFCFGETTLAGGEVTDVYWRNSKFSHLQKESSGTVKYSYIVNGVTYNDYDTRNGLDINTTTVEVVYLSFAPAMSRLNSFYNNWYGFGIGYLIFFTVTSFIFLIPNDTMPSNSYIYFTSKKPYLHMIIK